MNDPIETDIDLYQLSMLKAWYENNMHNNKAIMECFCRKLPGSRKFFLACGIGRIVDYLQNLKFTDKVIEFFCNELKSKIPHDNFKEYLKNINFAKEIKVFAPEEGDIIFANEPIVQLIGPIGLLEYVEKRILSIINSDVRRASKYARIVLAAKGKPVIEMGGRREHEGVSVDAARASYIAGFASTSNALAKYKYNIPMTGTQAHAFIMSFEGNELAAFNSWARVYENSTYLIDTYDVYDGLEHALKADPNLGAIRLDSGDLYGQATNIKRRLNKGDHCNAKIIATNDLNEYKIAALEEKGAPIDIYGVGTDGIITSDTPSIGAVYKLVEIYNNPVCKLSADSGKTTLPGRKQVWRHYAQFTNKLVMTNDIIDLHSTPIKATEICRPLLKEYRLDIVYDKKAVVQKAREKFAQVLTEMPEYLKLVPVDPKNEQPVTYPVDMSNQLAKLKQELIIKYKTSSA